MDCEDDEELNWPLIGGVGAGVFVLICLLFACCRKNKNGSNLMSAMMPALMMSQMNKNRDPPPRYDEEQPKDYDDGPEKRPRRPRGDPYASGDAAPAPAYISNDPGGQPPAYGAGAQEQIDPLLQAGMSQAGPDIMPATQPTFDPCGQAALQQLAPQYAQPAPSTFAPPVPMPAPASSFAPPLPVHQLSMPAPIPMPAGGFAYGPPLQNQVSYVQAPAPSFAPVPQAMSIQSGHTSKASRRKPKRSRSQPTTQNSVSRPSLAPTRSQSSAAWSASDLRLQRSGSSAGSRRPLLSKSSKGSETSGDASRSSPPTEALPESVVTKYSKSAAASKVEEPVVLSRSDFSGTAFRSEIDEKSQASRSELKRSKSEASIPSARPKLAKSSASQVSFKSSKSKTEDLLLPEEATMVDRPKLAKSSASQVSFKSSRSTTSDDLMLPDQATTVAGSEASGQEQTPKRRRKTKKPKQELI